MAGRENDREGTVDKMGQSGDVRGAFGTQYQEMFLTDSVKRVFHIEFIN